MRTTVRATNVAWMMLGSSLLTAPGWCEPAGKGILKVFVLAGQSNMVGAGAIKINPRSANRGKGTIAESLKLSDDDGDEKEAAIEIMARVMKQSKNRDTQQAAEKFIYKHKRPDLEAMDPEL